MQTMQTYTTMTRKKYGQVRSYFKREAENIGERFGNYRYNAIRFAVESVDPTHINDLLYAARGVGRYRETARVIKAMRFPFKRNPNPANAGEEFIPHAKMTKPQKERMKYIRNHWQDILVECELGESKKDAKVWDSEGYMNNVIKVLTKHNVNVIDFAEHLKSKAA